MSLFPSLAPRTLLLSVLCCGLTSALLGMPSSSQAIAGTPLLAQALTDSQKQSIIQQAKEYVTLIANQDYAKAQALLSPELQKIWTPERIGQLWQTELLDQAGSFQKILDAKVIDVVNADIVKLTVQFSGQTEDILLTFNKQQQLIAANWTTGKSIDQIVEEFVEALRSQDYAKARTYLSPLLKAEILPPRIQKGWTRLLERNGQFRKLLDVETKTNPSPASPDVAIATLKFTKGTQNVFIFFDKDRFITNIDLPEN